MSRHSSREDLKKAQIPGVQHSTLKSSLWGVSTPWTGSDNKSLFLGQCEVPLQVTTDGQINARQDWVLIPHWAFSSRGSLPSLFYSISCVCGPWGDGQGWEFNPHLQGITRIYSERSQFKGQSKPRHSPERHSAWETNMAPLALCSLGIPSARNSHEESDIMYGLLASNQEFRSPQSMLLWP